MFFSFGLNSSSTKTFIGHINSQNGQNRGSEDTFVLKFKGNHSHFEVSSPTIAWNHNHSSTLQKEIVHPEGPHLEGRNETTQWRAGTIVVFKYWVCDLPRGVLRFELDRGVPLEPQNPYPSLRVILEEKGIHF